jgi:hypothetical protein
MTLHADEYQAAPGRYEAGMPYRRVGRSGLDLPAISLGLWHNFGDDVPLERQQATLRRAFDRGVTHFDLPATPQRVWRAIAAAKAGDPRALATRAAVAA